MSSIRFNVARAPGIFINTASTSMASLMNFRRGVLNVRTALLLVLAVLVTSPNMWFPAIAMGARWRAVATTHMIILVSLCDKIAAGGDEFRSFNMDQSEFRNLPNFKGFAGKTRKRRVMF